MRYTFKTNPILSQVKHEDRTTIHGPNEVFINYIMQGKLLMPEALWNHKCPELAQFWDALWHNLLLKQESTTSTIYWQERVGNNKAFHKFLVDASNSGWIEVSTSSTSHWSDVKLLSSKFLKFMSQEQLTEVRLNFKLMKYSMLSVDKSDAVGDQTKINSGVRDTGLRREGFALSGNVPFHYDLKYLIKYKDVIIQNVTKSMHKIAEKLDNVDMEYADISTQIVEDFIFNPQAAYYTGSNTNDSRGRAIAECTRKIGNPITFKDFRALMIYNEPEVFEAQSVKYVYAYIAELLGVKASTQDGKIQAGKDAFKARTLPQLNFLKEKDRDKLHHLIWLERLYDELQRFFEFTDAGDFYFQVPGELDFTASMLAIQGTLLDHQPFLNLTNCISENGSLSDVWSKMVTEDNASIHRKMMKSSATPMLYGSSQTAAALWIKNNIEFNFEQVMAYNMEITHGDLAVANKLKESIIDNVVPKDKMTVKIWSEVFEIECNRFKYDEEKPEANRYNLYDTKSKELRTVTHVTPSKIADLDQFRRFFVTLLCHNLDSQVANYVMLKIMGISIHDAFIANFGSFHTIKERASDIMTAMHRDRVQIITDYCISIGIDPQIIFDIETIPTTDDYVCSHNCLK